MAPVKLPDVGSLLDKLVNRVPKIVTKHPVLTAGAIGTGIAASEIDRRARDTESTIMREQMGAPGSKYAETVKTSALQAYHQACQGNTKEALDFSSITEHAGEGIGAGAGKAVATEGIGGLTSLLRNIFLKAKDKTIDEPKRQKIVSNLLEQDPIVSSYERESPGGPQQAFSSMSRWAPELSTDANIVRSFLRQAAQTGGTLDYPSLKALTDAETSALKARQARLHQGGNR